MVWRHSTLPVIGFLLFLWTPTVQLRPQRYHLIQSSVSRYEAWSYCRVKYTNLATVNNMADNHELVKALGGHVTNSWIGLMKGTTGRWMWSDGRGPVTFAKWNQDEPNNADGNEWCGEMSDTSEWNDLPCEWNKGVMCYQRQDDGSITYEYKSGQKSWVSGQELCRLKHTDMAYVTTPGENSHIANIATQVWIGLFFDSWMWSDRAETSFRYWLGGMDHPENCATISPSQGGHWLDTNCNQKATFVCQGGLKVKKMIIKMTMSSDVDLTNSTVTDEILKMLETSLRLQFVTDFKISFQSVQREIDPS